MAKLNWKLEFENMDELQKAIKEVTENYKKFKKSVNDLKKIEVKLKPSDKE